MVAPGGFGRATRRSNVEHCRSSIPHPSRSTGTTSCCIHQCARQAVWLVRLATVAAPPIGEIPRIQLEFGHTNEVNAHDFEKAQYEFFQQGREFFSWFSGKNTPNILEMIARQIGALEVAMKVQATRRIEKITYATGADLADLSSAVTRHLREGWLPYGNVVVLPPNMESGFLQPMVIYAVEPPSPREAGSPQ